MDDDCEPEKMESAPASNGRDHRRPSRRAFLRAVLVAFLVGNVYLIGRRFRWWGNGRTTVMELPLPEAGPVLLDSRGSAFVEPKRLKLFADHRDKALKFLVEFQYKGNQSNRNRVALRIEVLDNSGRTLGSDKAMTSDARVTAAAGPIRLGPEYAQPSSRNYSVLKIPVTWPASKSADRVRLTFTNMGD